MKFFKTSSSVFICAAVLATLGAKADAATITVANPDFALFPAGQTAATYLNFGCGPSGPTRYACAFADNTVVGWDQSATFSEANDTFSGQWQIGYPQVTNAFNSEPLIDGTTPEPIVLREQNVTTTQTVSTTAVAGVTYTLDVDLGFESVAPDDGSVDLIVNGHSVLATPLASYHETQAQFQGSGGWYDFEASYTATSADAGEPIEILLSSLTHGVGFAFFGDVRLTDSLTDSSPPSGALATPEPATWAMMLIGFGGMAGLAVRRSFRRRSAVGLPA
jgi:PEP-CTERM motif